MVVVVVVMFDGDGVAGDALGVPPEGSEKRKCRVVRRIWQNVRARTASRRRANLRTWDWRERRVLRRVGENDFVRSLNILMVPELKGGV